VWMYNNANWEKANDLLAATDWQLLITGDIDESWKNWQKRFLEVMQECIPQKTLPPRHNLPWLSNSLVQLMRKRNQLFSQAKRSKREVDLAKYRKMRNRVFSQLRSAKANYFKRINPHDAKQFWKAVKYLNKAKSSIPVLTRDDVTARSDKEKADMISEYFTTCFN